MYWISDWITEDPFKHVTPLATPKSFFLACFLAFDNEADEKVGHVGHPGDLMIYTMNYVPVKSQVSLTFLKWFSCVFTHKANTGQHWTSLVLFDIVSDEYADTLWSFSLVLDPIKSLYQLLNLFSNTFLPCLSAKGTIPAVAQSRALCGAAGNNT